MRQIKAQFSAADSGAEYVRVILWKSVPVTVIKSRKAPKAKMRAKASKGFVKGTSGIPAGYPNR